MNKKYFEIVTLSDCADCNKKNLRANSMNKNHKGLGDLLSDIIGIANGIWSLFGKKELSMKELDQMFPGNSYWAVRLKAHLLKHIKWVDSNLATLVPQYTQYFMHENFNEITNGMYPNLYTGAWKDDCNWTCWLDKFYRMVRGETNVVPTESGIGGIGIVPLLLLGGLAFGFFNSKTQPRRARK